VTTNWTADQQGTGELVAVNGIELYTETRGAGRPLVLLHGGLGSGEMFGPVLPVLAAGRQVITVDLQGHGRTADIDRPLSLSAMGDDVAALVEHLGLEEPDLVGYSLGGGVALHAAAQHPGVFRRLVLTSAHFRSDAIYPEMRAQQAQVNASAAEFMKETPMYELYARVAPRPEDFGRLLDKIGESMAHDFDYSDLVRSLALPTLVAAGDADMAPPAHFAEFFALLGGGQRDGGWMRDGLAEGGHALAIVPSATHYDVFMSPLWATIVLHFLDA
jgi:pimeloyl-ACP methyl ester carboxylesterase